MPKLRSAKKRLRKDEKRKLANKVKKTAVKNVERQIKKTLTEGKIQGEALGKLVNQFYQAIDKAAKTGAIHKNKASREKSRLAVMIMKKTGTTAAKPAKPTAKGKVLTEGQVLTDGARKVLRPKSEILKAGKKTAKAKSPRATRKKGSRRKGK